MIFCVEDDSAIRNLMVYTLSSSGFEAAGFEDGKTFFAELEKQKPRLVILDIMLPGEDGIAILKRLKENPAFSDIPVIMATAKSTEYDKVIGLDSGADDYLSKPFGMMEMVSRIKAVLRRTETADITQILKIKNLELDMSCHTVFVEGERVELTLKEYEILCLFMKNPGKVFTRDRLLSGIWGAEYFGETRTVDVHIATLRTKLGACGEYIETVRGVGYRMEANL